MIEIATVSPLLKAGGVIGAVLLEAIVLYVGYGVLEGVIGNPVIEWIRNT